MRERARGLVVRWAELAGGPHNTIVHGPVNAILSGDHTTADVLRPASGDAA